MAYSLHTVAKAVWSWSLATQSFFHRTVRTSVMATPFFDDLLAGEVAMSFSRLVGPSPGNSGYGDALGDALDGGSGDVAG
jgi:hypothetical protein